MDGWFSVVGVIPSAATACAWKVNPIRTEAAPTAYLRMEKRCCFSYFIAKPPDCILILITFTQFNNFVLFIMLTGVK